MEPSLIKGRRLGVKAFRDGDILVTEEGMIFYAFGDVHPKDRAMAYLKYVPKALAPRFPITFQTTEWVMGEQTLVRPASLFTPENYQRILDTFTRHFPDYVYADPYCGKTLIAVPAHKIARISWPGEALKTLLASAHLDRLQSVARTLVTLLSRSSHVSLTEFGLHGSLALGTHTYFSDIDLSVYGGHNFRMVRESVGRLVGEGVVTYLVEDAVDELRRNKGVFQGKKFVVNALRKREEIREHYGQYCYHALRPLHFTAKIVDDREAPFKPAVYGITDYRPLDAASSLPRGREPTRLVSMNSRYRGVARNQQGVEVVGTYEQVREVEGRSVEYRVVVGSAAPGREEYLWPVG